MPIQDLRSHPHDIGCFNVPVILAVRICPDSPTEGLEFLGGSGERARSAGSRAKEGSGLVDGDRDRPCDLADGAEPLPFDFSPTVSYLTLPD